MMTPLRPRPRGSRCSRDAGIAYQHYKHLAHAEKSRMIDAGVALSYNPDRRNARRWLRHQGRAERA
jgi:hypothetical protein